MTGLVLLARERALHGWREWATATVKLGGTWSYVVGGRARLLGGVSPLPWWGARVLLVHHGAQNMLNGR